VKSNYLVCYDITDERRLRHVYKSVKQIGIHVQYSVFHCRLTWSELVQLEEGLKGIIDEKRDDIRIYPLPSDMMVDVMGRGDRIPEGVTPFPD
jgi:CRISPR-associated protein Cas2